MTATNDARTISAATARALLLRVMESEAQDFLARGTPGLEYRLWSEATQDQAVAGRVSDYPPFQWMNELAMAAEGWWVWPRDAMSRPGPSFLEMREWLPIYAAHRQNLIERFGPEGRAAQVSLQEKENRSILKAEVEKGRVLQDPPSPYSVRRETAAAHLLRLMEEEAEFNWASSWGPGHEYWLWASVVGDDPGTMRGTASEPDRLKELAILAHGWFTWREELREVEFVSLGCWVVMYRRYRESRREVSEDGKAES